LHKCSEKAKTQKKFTIAFVFHFRPKKFEMQMEKMSPISIANKIRQMEKQTALALSEIQHRNHEKIERNFEITPFLYFAIKTTALFFYSVFKQKKISCSHFQK